MALKILMAVSGLLLVGFLLGHMFGNLKVFEGPDTFNDYAHHLRILGEPILPEGAFLWIFRIVLLAAIIGHIYSAVHLWARAKKARDSRYQAKARYRNSYAEHTMRYGGVIVLLFIIFHILHLTTHTINPGGPADDPYARVIAGFEVPWVTIFYLAAVFLVCLHVAHGFWSACQTLGVVPGTAEKAIKMTAIAIAAVLLVGFASVPVAVMTNMIS